MKASDVSRSVRQAIFSLRPHPRCASRPRFAIQTAPKYLSPHTARPFTTTICRTSSEPTKPRDPNELEGAFNAKEEEIEQLRGEAEAAKEAELESQEISTQPFQAASPFDFLRDEDDYKLPSIGDEEPEFEGDWENIRIVGDGSVEYHGQNVGALLEGALETCEGMPVNDKGQVFDYDTNIIGRVEFDKGFFTEYLAEVAQEESNMGEELDSVRIVPASPSYFTGTPIFVDGLLRLRGLLRKYQTLPTVASGEIPRVAWKDHIAYKVETTEPVRAAQYQKIIHVLRRLNQIHPALMPEEVKEELAKYKKDVQPSDNKPNPTFVDELGRGYGVGRRKTSSARVWLVEGEGEVLVNGKSLTQMFARLHDRESAVWALKATQRIDKYNVWALVKGGGVTGQAEALTLGVAKALLVHEPALKPALRRAGCVTRDPREVERKKAGKVKARKMPAWVKR